MVDRPPLLAVLIDADNISARYAEVMFDEIASLGEASIRRIYGDFAGGGPQGWSKDKLANLAIVPHQQFAYTSGKNASDITLVIDAMDILHSGRFDGFVLISSDSDFTRLASRIREQGLDVYGIGQKKTPDAFRKACKRFIFVENLLQQDEPRETPRRDHAKDAIPMINAAMMAIDPEGEWFPLGLIGQTIQASHPDFDSRSFGVAKLSDLVEKAGRYEIRRDGAQVQVRRRD